MVHYLYFLLEDLSGKKLVEILMDKIQEEFSQNPPVFEYKSFHGSGCLKKQVGKSTSKTGSLLNDLPQYLRGLRGLADMEGASVVVVVDSDDKDVEQFRRDLEEIGRSNAPKLDCIYAIAVQEIEAWLLGDKEAVHKAYPHAQKRFLDKYDGEKEGTIGKWETLADVVYKGGSELLKKIPYSRGIGPMKGEWAERIGREMNLDANSSPSFNRFIGELRRRLNS